MNITKLTWTSVNSTVIKSVAYKKDALYLKFHSDAVYRYSKVPALVALELIQAKSVGVYFNANIRNIYKYKLLN